MKHVGIRIIVFCVLIVLVLWVSFPLAVVLMMLYALLWPGYELLLLGGMIDAQFGYSGATILPSYLLAALGTVLLALWLRPLVTFYDSPSS